MIVRTPILTVADVSVHWVIFFQGIKENVVKRSVSFRHEDRDTGEVLTVPSARKFKISTALPAPVTDCTR